MKFSIVVAAATFLSGCAVVQSSNIEDMPDGERLAFLQSKSDAQLCMAYNHPLIKPGTEQQVQEILRTRQVGRCDSRGKVRLIPLGANPVAATPDQAPVPEKFTAGSERASAPQASGVAAPLASSNSRASVVQPIRFGTNADLKRDIEALQRQQLVKSNFESESEFKSRRAEFLKSFDSNRGYRVTLDIKNPENKRDKIVFFDPDRSEVRVMLPRISRDLVWLDSNGDKKLKWLHNSFVETEIVDIKMRTYKAANRLGASTEVIETRKESMGLAVLHGASKDYSRDARQVFTFPMGRDQARELLSTGKVVLEAVIDVRYPTSEATPFLLRKEDKHEPSFSVPIDMSAKQIALPVRLRAVSLTDKSGKEVGSARATEIDGNAAID